ncbi:MAG: amidohydrolase family protein [Allorhizobium sp.]
MERIDAHCHFWALERGDYGWLRGDEPSLAPIFRDFSPADIAPLSQSADIARLIAVQAAASEAETRYLLSLSDEHDEIAGVVGWVDLSSLDAPARIESLAAHPKLKGVRPMLQDIEDDNWIITAPTSAALDALGSSGLRFDALVLPRHLAALEQFVASRPGLAVVIDHAAKPALGAGADDPRHAIWSDGMTRLAAFPQVCCKLSGFLTEMRPEQCASHEAALAVLRPVIGQLLDWFGPERLIWGSDWPVVTLAAPHADWVSVSQILLSDLTDADRDAVFGGNAARFYGLEEAA